ncbi:MAG: ATP-binding protein, partial [Proteobacteria bacterium]|nr:ATP-binding protein [Pseudomonadota bacterium]
EPFFTTRAGRGSGLGLPMVQHFAEHAGGAAFIESVAAKGTTVHLLLPAARRDP